MRADLFLVQHGFAESRQRAKTLIEAGEVLLHGKAVSKASQDLDEDAKEDIVICGNSLRYVSRGGLKLEHALDCFHLDVSGMRAVDFGASTGGFTDCLLQRGAEKVFAVDSGRDQLHPKLRADSRVVCMEECNARYLSIADLGTEEVDLAVCDLSFISQTKIYDAVCSVLREGGIFISLIKPQFEAGKEYLNKHGICRSEAVHERVKGHIRDAARRVGLLCEGICDSPITGGDGNREYLAIFKKAVQAGKESGEHDC